MSVSSTSLLNFSRTLPAPFGSLSTKKVKVSSVYGDKTEATLNATVIKAVNAYCDCLNGKGSSAVGLIDHRSVAEYDSSAGPDAFHLVVYDSIKGSVMASLYDKNTECLDPYKLHTSAQDGAAIVLAMMPFLMKDTEFEGQFNLYRIQRDGGYPNMTQATNAMGILCDNVYRRIKDDSCSAHINVSVVINGNICRITSTHLDSCTFTPASVVAGEFTIFAKTGRTTVSVSTNMIDHRDFVGKYQLTSGRKLSMLEESLVPKLEDWYVIPDEVVNICNHALHTTGKPMQMRNFLMRGPAGTGKTQGAMAIAAGLHLPYMKYTCSASTEVFDFVGMVFPKTDDLSTGDAQLDQERAELNAMGGITYANVARLMKLPDLDDMDYDPASVFHRLTGASNPAATAQDCMEIVMELVTEKLKLICKPADKENTTGQTYTYVETDFIKALKSGYLVELQEPTVITQPGVLVGLNSLLEQNGSITLPTGEIIQRHPDTVIVVTTNVTYEGCRGLNRATRS